MSKKTAPDTSDGSATQPVTDKKSVKTDLLSSGDTRVKSNSFSSGDTR
jgi:hypothetical protein